LIITSWRCHFPPSASFWGLHITVNSIGKRELQLLSKPLDMTKSTKGFTVRGILGIHVVRCHGYVVGNNGIRSRAGSLDVMNRQEKKNIIQKPSIDHLSYVEPLYLIV